MRQNEGNFPGITQKLPPSWMVFDSVMAYIYPLIYGISLAYSLYLPDHGLYLSAHVRYLPSPVGLSSLSTN